MTRKSLLLALALLAAALSCSKGEVKPEEPPRPSPPAAELIEQADKLYAERGQSLESVRRAVSFLRLALARENRNYEAAWKLARAAYYLGAHGADEGERLESFREGITAGEQAAQFAPDAPEGHFWHGANLGGRAKLQGPIYALASVEEIRRDMQTVIRLDEGFQGGSAYLALGQLDLELPEMFGGDDERAVEELERGLAFGENNALLRVKLAEAYLKLRRTADARRQLQAVLKMKPSPDFVPEYTQAAAEARKLLEKTG
ncbi:MAG TPA: TRAP transporter TatT component family protein [Pyrinomonadaceae bacterium]|jgi:tetratricopeptide (TPR) repeat protein|nr:TRAP transporter TatT component family protein [Pyrinomonadaceae bacterium]